MKMILTEKVKVNISFNNKEHYSKYFDNLKIGNQIEISPDELSKNSHLKILVMCDICKEEKFIPYREYLQSFDNGNYYSCRKCNKDKFRNTCIERYGVNHPLKNKEIRDKIEETNLNKYGCKNVFQSDIIKNKIKETNLKKYGVEYSGQSENNKKKSKKTCLSKYGVEHHLKNNNCHLYHVILGSLD